MNRNTLRKLIQDERNALEAEECPSHYECGAQDAWYEGKCTMAEDMWNAMRILEGQTHMDNESIERGTMYLDGFVNNLKDAITQYSIEAYDNNDVNMNAAENPQRIM